MNNSNFEFIYSILGTEAEPIEIEVGRRKWQGLAILNYPSGQLSLKDAIRVEKLRPMYKKKINENWRFFHRRNIRLWSQSGVDVYAIPEMPVLEIVVYSCVGQISYLEDDNHFKEIGRAHV